MSRVQTPASPRFFCGLVTWNVRKFTKGLAAVGFEPTPPKRLVPKTSALDHSATLPIEYLQLMQIENFLIPKHFEKQSSMENGGIAEIETGSVA
jgi:hypothetical protein